MTDDLVTAVSFWGGIAGFASLVVLVYQAAWKHPLDIEIQRLDVIAGDDQSKAMKFRLTFQIANRSRSMNSVVHTEIWIRKASGEETKLEPRPQEFQGTSAIAPCHVLLAEVMTPLNLAPNTAAITDTTFEADPVQYGTKPAIRVKCTDLFGRRYELTYPSPSK